MASKKVFCDQTKSKLDELYKDGSADEIINKRAVLNLYDIPISFDVVVDKLKKQPFVSTIKKSAQLDFRHFDFDKMKESVANIMSIPKGKETGVIEMVMVDKIPQVKFMPSEMITVGNKQKFAVPRFSIDLSKETIGAHCGVRINTGYVVKINPITMGKTISGGKIVNTTVGTQPDFMVIPQIVSNHDGLIQCIYGRDPEDTGLLTINFTTTKALDTSKPLQVLLNAYIVERPLGMASIHNSENTTELFKAKDNRSGRWVKNPKTKFLADSFDTTTIAGSLLLKTFDNSTLPVVMYERQRIKIDKVVTLFTSRKREWCDPNLVTFAGIYNPISGKHSEGLTLKCCDVKHNTHGMTFIKNKITIFSVMAKFNYDCRILNGSFYNMPSYTEINKEIRKVSSSLTNLAIGAKICQNIVKSNPEYQIRDLLRIFDYDRSITADARLPHKVLDTDEKLFNERPADLHCYSVLLHKGLKSLAYQCCGELFNEEQLKTLSLSCSKVVDDGSMKRSNSNVEEEEGPAQKRVKTE